jgi:RNA polymerase sigma-70 factor (ECF subfamily)
MTNVLALERTVPSLETRVGSLYDAHHENLYRLARRLCRNADDARELLQETFLRAARAHRSIPTGTEGERAWLVRVLLNAKRDEWRKTARRRQLDPTPLPERQTGSVDAEAPLIARRLVWEALDQISPRRRAILVLYELEGATAAAIAQLLGLRVVTVRWHLMKGRQELAKIISSNRRREHE